MPTEECLATVIIPVFNSAPTLWRAARSALRQAVSPLEILIVDDGSRDSSLLEARRIAELDKRVRVIALPENRGKPFAMNRATDEARGTWIAVLDADDCYADDRLAILIGAAEKHGVDLAADNQYLFDAAAGQLVGTAFATSKGDMPLSRRDFIEGSDAFAEFNYGMLKPIVRADFVRRYGLRYRESARLGEDFLWLVEFFARAGHAFLVSRPLYHWTQAFGGVSRQWTGTGAGPWRYDFLSALAPISEVRATLRPGSDSDLIALLDRRERAFRKLHWLGELSRMRAHDDGVGVILSMIARHPTIWPELSRRALRAALGRYRIGVRRPRVDGAVT